MQAATALIDFLMSLMRDDETRTAFTADPQGMLARNNLDGVTGQDVRDACLVMADSGAISSRGQNWSSSTDDDPVRQIHHTTTNYELRDQEFNYVNIEDNDTLINDSFNDDDTIEDSFNSDDDGVDTDTTTVVAIQDNDTVNNDVDVTEIEDSFNEVPAEDTPVTILPVAEPEIIAAEPAIPEPVHTEPIAEEPVEDEPELDPVIG